MYVSMYDRCTYLIVYIVMSVFIYVWMYGVYVFVNILCMYGYMRCMSIWYVSMVRMVWKYAMYVCMNMCMSVCSYMYAYMCGCVCV